MAGHSARPSIKNNLNIFILIFSILIILNILLNIFNANKIINYTVLGLSTIYLMFNLILFIKNKIKLNKINIKNNNEEIKLKKELEIIKENKNKIEKEINNLNNILNEKNKINYDLIKNKYINESRAATLAALDSFDNLFNINLDEIKIKLENEKDIYNEIKIKLNTIEIEEKNILNKLEEKASYEEELINLNEQKEELLKLENAINIAKASLENAYNKMKNKITPKFTKELTDLVDKISDGKYKNINFNDTYGLRVELDNGDYIDSNLLSLGTIDQLYLSLRLSAIKQISEEKMPVILDESFVYYDKERLKNILKYLNEYCNNVQIIILSCSNREKEAMDELKINYNYIEI